MPETTRSGPLLRLRPRRLAALPRAATRFTSAAVEASAVASPSRPPHIVKKWDADHVECAANRRSRRPRRRSGARQYADRFARRPRAHRDRIVKCRRRLAADHKRPSRQAQRRTLGRADEAGPPPLLSARRAAGGADAGELHECRARWTAALSAEDACRRTDAPRAHLLRPFRRTARRSE